MATVTKKDLVCGVAEKCDCQQSIARVAVQSFLDQIVAELSRGSRIELREFGVFETRTRPAHTARNPRTKEPVSVPARASVKFKAGHAMKEKIQVLAQAAAPSL
ncbi:MAG: HU family DNA-binding protein [Planctomycetota bacterium]